MHVQDTETLLYIVNRPYTYFINIKQYTQVVLQLYTDIFTTKKKYYKMYIVRIISTL